MNKYPYKLLVYVLLLFILCNNKIAYAITNIERANSYLLQASTGITQDEKDYYTNKAKEFYTREYNRNNLNIDAMIGIGRTCQSLNQRTDAKNILMQAYNTYPNNPKIQAALGDFNYYFQEYNTALEFYKLALSSGYLKDYKTNLSTALCYEKLGDIKNSILYYKITVMLNPNETEAKERLSQLQNPSNITNECIQKTVFQNTTNDENIEINTIIEDSKNIR